MRTTKCRLCGGKLFPKPVMHFSGMPKSAQFLPAKGELGMEKGVSMNVLQCSACGLVQLDGRPVPYYREVIRAAAFSEEMGEFRRKQFSAFVRDNALKGRKVVEIGCGKGEYLGLMKSSGVKAFGLEYRPGSVKYCRENGLNVSRGFPGKAGEKIPGAPFDAFFILNFLEHLPDLKSVLGGIHANLAPGAVGLVEVPNFDMILSRQLFSEFITDHLFYFTRETLGTALRMNGFEVEDCRVIWHDYIISAAVRRRAPMDVSGFDGYCARLKRDVRGYVNSFRPGRVAVWGAGHQSLAVLAIAGLAGRVRYVVDSAPFKQGRYTPATHLRIVSPDVLASEPVDAVLIMAASYSDEVAGILKTKFGSKMKIAILRDSGLETTR